MEPPSVLKRLDAIGQSLAATDHTLALLALGSVGLEQDRLDAFSDLDFFVLVEPGHKQAFLADLRWLTKVHPIDFSYRETPDGIKAFFTDGILCEFAVFEPQELSGIPYAPGRFVWRREGVPDQLATPATARLPPTRTREWLVGDALSNLVIGLRRDHRGERLSAMRFIQSYAADRALELAAMDEAADPALRDRFSNERRFERRHPSASALLPSWFQGYTRNRESALAILLFLEQHGDVPAAMSSRIRRLCTST